MVGDNDLDWKVGVRGEDGGRGGKLSAQKLFFGSRMDRIGD